MLDIRISNYSEYYMEILITILLSIFGIGSLIGAGFLNADMVSTIIRCCSRIAEKETSGLFSWIFKNFFDVGQIIISSIVILCSLLWAVSFIMVVINKDDDEWFKIACSLGGILLVEFLYYLIDTACGGMTWDEFFGKTLWPLIIPLSSFLLFLLFLSLMILLKTNLNIDVYD